MTNACIRTSALTHVRIRICTRTCTHTSTQAHKHTHMHFHLHRECIYLIGEVGSGEHLGIQPHHTGAVHALYLAAIIHLPVTSGQARAARRRVCGHAHADVIGVHVAHQLAVPDAAPFGREVGRHSDFDSVCNCLLNDTDRC